MLIRHVVAQANVDAHGLIVDPARARHAVIVGGQIVDLAGEVDPRTHLNQDFPDHRLDRCVVVAELRPGAPALFDADGFRTARVRPEDIVARGPVDRDARRLAWLAALRQRRSA